MIYGDLGDDVDECDESDEDEAVVKVKIIKNIDNQASRNKVKHAKTNTFVYKQNISKIGVCKAKTAISSARGASDKENFRQDNERIVVSKQK